MNTHLVIGAGAVGSAITEQLTSQGETVVLVTRSGTSRGTTHPVTQCDASDVVTLKKLMEHHRPQNIFACMHGSKYSADVWLRELPPLEASILSLAEEKNIPVIFPESLYAFGEPIDGVFRENSELRASHGKPAVRKTLLQQRRHSRAVTISVVASDYFGPYDRTSHVGQLIIPKILAGKRAQALGSAHQPHSFTYVPDLANAMIIASQQAAELAHTGDRIVFAPTGKASSMAEMTQRIAEIAHIKAKSPRVIPSALIKGLAPIMSDLRDMKDVLYQWIQPFTMDSSESEKILGLIPTGLDAALVTTLAEARGGANNPVTEARKSAT